MDAKLKKKSLAKVKKKCWEVFSLYIRTRDALRTTKTQEEALCITCDRRYPIKAVGGLQAGHFLAGRHNSVLFDERNCHAQCYGCNVMLKGNQIKYFRKMQLLYGDKVIEELEQKDTETRQFKSFELEEMIETYKNKLKLLS